MSKHGDATTERVYAAIIGHWQQHGYGPSVRDIQRLAGLSSSSVVEHHLCKLAALGLITKEKGKARTIRVVTHSLADTLSSLGMEPKVDWTRRV